MLKAFLSFLCCLTSLEALVLEDLIESGALQETLAHHA